VCAHHAAEDTSSRHSGSGTGSCWLPAPFLYGQLLLSYQILLPITDSNLLLLILCCIAQRLQRSVTRIPTPFVFLFLIPRHIVVHTAITSSSAWGPGSRTLRSRYFTPMWRSTPALGSSSSIYVQRHRHTAPESELRAARSTRKAFTPTAPGGFCVDVQRGDDVRSAT
jgi:hypothetical protein